MHQSERRRSIAVGVVIAACAASAGAHAGLVPEHLRESPALGVAFIVSVAVLLGVVVVLAIRPGQPHAITAAAVLLAGLLAAWAASRTSGLPWLEPHPEPVDAVSVATKVVEAIGLACALVLIRQPGGRRSPTIQEGLR